MPFDHTSVMAPTGKRFDPLAVTDDSAPLVENPAPVEPDWEQLFAGVDESKQHMTSLQREAFDSFGRITPQNVGARASAINQAYITRRLPDWSPEAIQEHWPTIRRAFAKTTLGIDKEEIDDAALYEAINQHEKAKTAHLKADFIKGDPMAKLKTIGGMFLAHTGRNAGELWDKGNTPFVRLPSAPQIPDVPGYGPVSPAVVAGVYNSVRPILEGIETPIGVVTLPAAGTLKAVSGASKLAKSALVAMGGIFTGLMAKSTYDTAKAAPAVLNDPKSTLQQRIEAVGTPVAAGLVTLLGATGTLMEMKGSARGEAIVRKVNGKTPDEAANIIRMEEALTPEEAAAQADVAARLDEIGDAGLKKAAETAEGEPTITELEHGGFVVTDSAGKLIDYAGTADEAAALLETVKATETPKATETTAKPQPKPVEPATGKESGLVSIKNETIDAQRAEMGLPPATHGEKLSFDAARQEAAQVLAADPMAGRNLVKELQENPRPATGRENALLLTEMNTQRIARDAAEARFLEATKSGDPAAIESAKLRVAQAVADFDQLSDVVTRVGTENAQGLALRAMMMKEDYSLASLERRARVANEGKPLPEPVQAEIRDLHQRLSAAEQSLAEFTKARTERITAAKPRESKLFQVISEQAASARERIKARQKEGRVQSGLDPADLADHAIVGAEYLAKGVRDFAKWSGEMVRDFGDRIKDDLQEIYDKAKVFHDSNAEKAKGFGERMKSYALVAYKARLRKRIASLERQIETKVKEPPEKRTPLHDEEIVALRERRDTLQEQFDEVFKDEKLTEAQQVSRLEKSAERQITELERQLRTNELFPASKKDGPTSAKLDKLRERIDELKEVRDYARELIQPSHAEKVEVIPKTEIEKRVAMLDRQIAKLDEQVRTETVFEKGKKEPASSPEIAEREARLAELRERRDNLRQQLQPDEEPLSPDLRKLRDFKKRSEKQIKELKDKLASGDVLPEPKPEPLHLDPEANRLKAEVEMLRTEVKQRIEMVRYEASSPAAKALENALVGWDSTRAILAGFEFSAVGRQGGLRLFSHPVKTVRALGDSFKALVANKAEAHAINLKTLDSPEAIAARKDGVALVDSNSAMSKREEIYMGKLVSKIPGVRNFEQFAYVFLNRIRTDMFTEMRKDFPQADPKLLGAFVNSVTGRGSLGKLESAAVFLNRGLFSPRFLASRLQTGTGYYLWKAALKGDRAAVKAVSRQYAQTMIGYAVALSALGAGIASFTDEDVSVGTDPLASDFGKLKVGKTRIDIAAGLVQPLVFMARLAAGEKTNAKGKTVPIRGEGVPFGGDDALDVAKDFARSKANPSASKLMDFGTGKNIVGEPATLVDLLYPATYGDIKEVFEAHDIPEATLISLLALFGAGLQTYDPNAKKKTKPKAAPNFTPSTP